MLNIFVCVTCKMVTGWLKHFHRAFPPPPLRNSMIQLERAALIWLSQCNYPRKPLITLWPHDFMHVRKIDKWNMMSLIFLGGKSIACQERPEGWRRYFCIETRETGAWLNRPASISAHQRLPWHTMTSCRKSMMILFLPVLPATIGPFMKSKQVSALRSNREEEVAAYWSYCLLLFFHFG